MPEQFFMELVMNVENRGRL
jgi:hypothetical protein